MKLEWTQVALFALAVGGAIGALALGSPTLAASLGGLAAGLIVPSPLQKA